ERPFCLPGLERTYGLAFKRFVPLDAGGPITLTALEDGEIDLALLFSTDPHLVTDGLVVLRDDGGLEPAENVTPVVRHEVIDRFGPRVAAVIDRVSARITTTDLQTLDGLVAVLGVSPRA